MNLTVFLFLMMTAANMVLGNYRYGRGRYGDRDETKRLFGVGAKVKRGPNWEISGAWYEFYENQALNAMVSLFILTTNINKETNFFIAGQSCAIIKEYFLNI